MEKLRVLVLCPAAYAAALLLFFVGIAGFQQVLGLDVPEATGATVVAAAVGCYFYGSSRRASERR